MNETHVTQASHLKYCQMALAEGQLMESVYLQNKFEKFYSSI